MLNLTEKNCIVYSESKKKKNRSSVFQNSSGFTPRGRLGKRCRHYVSQPAWEWLGMPHPQTFWMRSMWIGISGPLCLDWCFRNSILNKVDENGCISVYLHLAFERYKNNQKTCAQVVSTYNKPT